MECIYIFLLTLSFNIYLLVYRILQQQNQATIMKEMYFAMEKQHVLIGLATITDIYNP